MPAAAKVQPKKKPPYVLPAGARDDDEQPDDDDEQPPKTKEADPAAKGDEKDFDAWMESDEW